MKTTVLRDSRGRILARFWLDTAKGTARALAALVDLAARLWLAQAFLVSGLLKVGNWNNALELAANEYPVSWLDPVTAAYVGASIELLCPIFLAVGLFTRAAAFPMLVPRRSDYDSLSWASRVAAAGSGYARPILARALSVVNIHLMPVKIGIQFAVAELDDEGKY